MKDGILQYDALLSLYPWLIAREQKAIISPDVDGILCALLMSHYFNWKVVGFYDGKELALKQGVDVKTCIFLDMDIYRTSIRSCGHHMVAYNRNSLPPNWDNYANCINPNLIRGFDALHEFQQKYPFGTIHFLLCALGSSGLIKNNLYDEAISTLLYADGAAKNLFNYPENCTSWFGFLDVKNSRSPVHSMFVKFANIRFEILMRNLKGILSSIKQIAGTKRFGGCKIKIRDTQNNFLTKQFHERIEKLAHLLAQNTGWDYEPKRWSLTHLNLRAFHVGIQ